MSVATNAHRFFNTNPIAVKNSPQHIVNATGKRNTSGTRPYAPITSAKLFGENIFGIEAPKNTAASSHRAAKSSKDEELIFPQ